MTLVDQDWDHLKEQLTGSLALPNEDGYAAAAPWNCVEIHPAAVAVVADAEDVGRVVRWAGEHGMRVAVQATGHSALPWSVDTILVSTAQLRSVEVDPESRRAVIGAGVRAGELLEAAAVHGLVPVSGSASSVGVVGHITGGGIGPMSRTLGISSDWVRSLDVVTGDGEIRHASGTQNTDLFWGLRGGKATLGIVTSAVVELVECTSFFGGNLYFAGDDIARVLRGWPDWAKSLPEQATSSICLINLPEMPGVPPAMVGRRLSVRLTWLGDAVDEQKAREVCAGAEPIFGQFAIMGADEIPAVHQDPVDGHPFDTDGYFLSDFDTTAAHALLEVAGPESGTPLLAAEIRQLGGATRRTPDAPDAFNGRDAQFHLMTGGVPIPSPEQIAEAAERVKAALRPWSTGRSMPNFVVRADSEALADYYDDATRMRLSQLAERFDPNAVYAVGQVARRSESSGIA